MHVHTRVCVCVFVSACKCLQMSVSGSYEKFIVSFFAYDYHFENVCGEIFLLLGLLYVWVVLFVLSCFVRVFLVLV